jgi:hypothetical protein
MTRAPSLFRRGPGALIIVVATAFGIQPYRRFLGAVAVADRLRLDVAIEAVRRPGPAPP